MRTRLIMWAVPAIIFSYSTHSGESYGPRYNPGERVEKEYRLFQAGGTKGSYELWVPYKKLPETVLWTDLKQPPPISMSKAIAMAVKESDRSRDSLLGVMLSKQAPTPPSFPKDVSRFWQYVITLGNMEDNDTYVIHMNGRVFKVDEFHPWPEKMKESPKPKSDAGDGK